MDPNFSNPIDNNDEDSFLDLMALVNILLGKWYWFVLSALLFLSLATVYIYRSNRVYQKYSTVLIKDVRTHTQMSTFADIAGITGMGNNNVDNELVVFKSRSIMEQVVKQLGLHITYFEPQWFREVELYETLPFRLREAENNPLMPASFTIEALDDASFRYADESASFTARFGEPVKFPFGTAVVEARPQWLSYYLKQPVRIQIGSVSGTASGMLQGLSVNLIAKNASVIQLRQIATRPGKAADILNKLVDVYNTESVNDKNLIIESSAGFIKERIAIVAGELDDVDGRIEQYKKQNLSNNASSEASQFFSAASGLEQALSENELQISLVTILNDFLRQPGNARELLPFNMGLDHASLNQQIQSYNENLIKVNRLINASSERNPVVADLNASLETLRTSIAQTVADVQKSLKLKQTELQQRTRTTSGRIAASTTHEKHVQSITREQKIKVELYLYLLNKQEENAILKSMTEANARVLDRAYGGDAPISPQRTKIWLAALMVGLLIPAAWFVLKDMFYTKVRGRNDVTRVVKAPMLGEIPAKPNRLRDKFLVVENGNNTHLSEAFRILRTNLQFLNSGRNQVIAFTSTMPGEGKTYISANMAMAFALAGKKVCLVGLDLRRPTLQAAFGKKGQKGVADYLVHDHLHLSDLIHRTEEHKNLFLLPAGTIPPNPAELLMSNRFDAMIAELRERFDYVILDNPPMNLVSDTSVSNRVADITLYIVRAGVLNRRELIAIQDTYKENKLRNMGLIITDVDYERLYYSVGYTGYGKRYGYSVGYSGYEKGYYSSDTN